MNAEEKNKLLALSKDWFRESISKNHIKNSLILEDPKKLTINPFLAVYLSNFLTGNSDPKSIAKALIYPRVLGTSITTSFGTNIQQFTSQVLSSFGSTTSGIDIEFIDKIDGDKKYCQLKSGPNTINKDDVETIAGHFKSVINLGRTNRVKIPHEDMIVGIIYGEQHEISQHYQRITKQYHYPVMIGQDFWHRLTGDAEFYDDLIRSIGEVATEANFATELEEVIDKLSKTPEIQKLSS
ncbi:hypothetical cytosolic protein [hydrothermal vent metagenome]|uniref:Hypothetical cytosolic protein n=1 Tax=hydrothermal vent metagenome TaxID=652676 RepID=A0A3B0VPY2_9ZZZZ